VIYHRM